MSTKNGSGLSQDQQSGGQVDPSKKYEELLRLKNVLQSAEGSKNPSERLANLQRLRNEAQELRLRLSVGSTNPSLEDISRLSTFATSLLQDIAKDSRAQTLPGTHTTSQSFQSPMVNRVRSAFVPTENESDKLAEQNRIASEVKNSIDKRLDRIETVFNSRLDRFENVLTSLGSRLDRVESNLTAVQSAQIRAEDNNSRSFARMEDQYASLNKKIDNIEDRQNRRVDDLMKERQPSGPLIPPVVHLNVTGLLPQLGNMQLSSVQQTTPVPETGARASVPETSQPIFSELPPRSTSAASQPLVVNVPKPKASIEHLTTLPLCSPLTSVAENKSSTVNWGAPKAQPVPRHEEIKVKSAAVVDSNSLSNHPTEISKPPAFSGFSGFSTPSKSLIGAASATSDSFSGMFKNAAGGLTFSSLAQNADNAVGGFAKDPKGFAGSGSKLFATLPASSVVKPKEEEEEDEIEGGDDKEYEPKVDFKPLVSLPEVKVTTGEEEYETVFKDRGKLFRYDNATKEWKERGLGDMTLQKKVDPSSGRITARVLMRWEKTFKICANHSITPEIKMMQKSETEKSAWRWYANDFADGEVKLELLCIRFRTKEQADLFKITFEDLQSQIVKQGGTAVKIQPSVANKESSEPKSLSDMFKPKAGEWNCGGCYVSNPADKAVCIACGTPKPGSTVPPSSGTFSFGKTAEAPPFSFGYKPASQLAPAEVKPFSGFAKGETANEFLFGTPSKGESKPKPASATQSGGFSFGSLTTSGGFKFDLGQANQESSPKKQDDDEGGEDDVEAERHDLIFEPVVQLPDKVDLKTGEENEIELYCQRAKLYRFDSGEWKERGLGDIRMMKDRNSSKIRLLMRREKILKVCCNHFIRPEMTLKPMPNTKNTWIWEASDFSEGKSEHQLLAVRFKHEAHANEFKELFQRAQHIVEGKESANVETFPRIQVDEAEALAPIAESGKKAIEMMSVNNPFQNPPKSCPSSGVEEVKLRQTTIGDEIYKNFGVIYDGFGKVSAIFVPNIGFRRLTNQSDLGALAAASAKSENAFKELMDKYTNFIDLQKDVKNIPEAVRRYVRASKVKDIFESELWALPIFEHGVSLSRKIGDANWEELPTGILRLMPHEYDQPCIIQFITPETDEVLAFHCIAADADLQVDHLRRTFQWKAVEESLNEKAFCLYKAFLKDDRAVEKFERLMKDGMVIAEQQDVWNEGSD